MNQNDIDDAQKLIERFFREGLNADCVVWVQARGYVHVFMRTPAMIDLATAWAARGRGRPQGDQAGAA